MSEEMLEETEVGLPEEEAEIVSWVIEGMRKIPPYEMIEAGFEEEDIPVLEDGILTLSDNSEANYALLRGLEEIFTAALERIEDGTYTGKTSIDAAYTGRLAVSAAGEIRAALPEWQEEHEEEE